jgi:hypothetical protein
MLQMGRLPGSDSKTEARRVSDDDDDLFDVDLDDAKAVYVYDSSAELLTSQSLTDLGFAVKSARLGSELMAATQDGRVRGVIVGADADPELRELFMRAFHGRFPNIPVAYISRDAGSSTHVAALRAEGALVVIPWPLPPSHVLIPELNTLFSTGPSTRLEAARPSTVLGTVAEQQLLARKVDALEAVARPKTDPAIPKEAFEHVVQQAAKKTAENTELRTELTLVRDRNAMLEDRAKRLAKEVKSLSKELEDMRAEMRASRADPVFGSSTLPSALDGLVPGVETYGWGLEQAIQYFEELKLKVGSRAPSLDVHLRTLRLVRALLERLREQTAHSDENS